MIFTRTLQEADAVCGMLKHHGYRGESSHHALRHSPRRNAWRRLRDSESGKYDILVATDVAARGIDISAA